MNTRAITAETTPRERECTLFVCRYQESLRSTVLPLCRALNVNGDGATHVIMDRASDQMAEMCRAAGVRFTRRGRPSAAPPAGDEAPRPLRSARWISKMLIDVAKGRRRIRRMVAELDRHQPTAMVLLDDRTIFTCRWIRAAQIRRIPTIVVQWSAIHHAETMISLRAAHQRGLSKPWLVSQIEQRVARLVPEAVVEHQGEAVWFMPADQVLAAWATETFPRHTPWAFGGGNADVVAAMGLAWKQRMIAGGVPASKIVVTGHPEHDQWRRAAAEAGSHRTQMLDKLHLAADRRLVTLVAPALRMRDKRGSRLDISMENLRASLTSAVDAVIQLGEPFVPVVKVHPRDNLADLSFLQRRCQLVKILKNVPPCRLIAASDLMACQWSTTAMIGPATGTPVVLFDFHETTSAEVWRGVDGLPVAKNPRYFNRLLKEALHCDSTRHQLLSRQQGFIDEYLCLDGQSTERLTTLIRERSMGQAMRVRRQAA